MTGWPPPPLLARYLLTLALPPDDRDHVLDDLEDVYRNRCDDLGHRAARHWYWRETISFAGRFAFERLIELVRGVGPVIEPDPRERRPHMEGAVDRWTGEFRHAARRLLRAPGFTLICAATLALAIGANTAIFTVVDAVLINPLSYPAAERLVMIRGIAPGSELRGEFDPGPEFFVAYRDEANLLEDIGMFRLMQSTARADDKVDRLYMVAASASLFSTLGARPLVGRLPTREDDMQRTPVMVISHWLWTTWFGADPGIVGRSFEAAGQRRTVIGVMRPEFRFPDARRAIWIRASIADERRIAPGSLGFFLVGRTKPGVKHSVLAAQLDAIAKGLPERFGGDASYARLIAHHRPVVRSLEEQLVGRISQPLWIILSTVGIVFLIACANVANLFIARAESRRRDLAVRHALGAGRLGLIRSQAAEALLLATAGAAGGVSIAAAMVPLLVRAAPEGVPNLDLVAVNPLALAFTAALALLAACLFGLVPAIRFSRPGALADLRQAGGVGGARGHVTRNVLVVAQTAAALVLLVAAGLLARSLWELSRVDLGYDTKDVFTFQVAPSRKELNDGPSFALFHQGLLERLGGIPGVESVGLVNELPLDEAFGRGRFGTERTEAGAAAPPILPYTHVAGDYFQTLRVALVSGRLFESTDHQVGMANAIVSRSAAQHLWPSEDPLGKRLRFGTDPAADPWLTIVGVVEDIRATGFRQDAPDPLIYLPLVGPAPRTWVVGSPAYVVRSPRAASMAADVRALLREYAPEAPMYRIFTMEALSRRALAQVSFTLIMLGIASGLALILGAVGLYGVLSYIIAQRTREIAVRMALGAEATAVRRMVVVQGGRVALIGVALGVLAALATTRVLESLLFGVTALDVSTFLAMSGLMLAVAVMASYLPAHRASAVDPIQALRTD
ncbi:MAG TPA: ABC transporter permease [Vicinamibacterales bacterium]|nr:ABC transporter permease [Vicinamibacterales bacterium]